MRTFYVQGTKKAANEDIANKKKVVGVEYKMGETNQVFIHELNEVAVLKFWKKKDLFGNPIASSYGNWSPEKNKIL